MYVSKTKNYTNLVSLSQLKEDLSIAEDDSSYDGRLNRLVKSVLVAIEKRVGCDLVPTTNQLEDYSVYGCYYSVNDSPITISAVTITNNITTTPVTTVITGYTVQKYSQFTTIVFSNGIAAEKINIVYGSGFTMLADDLQHVVRMLVKQYFDVDQAGYAPDNLKESKAVDRLLAPYLNVIS